MNKSGKAVPGFIVLLSPTFAIGVSFLRANYVENPLTQQSLGTAERYLGCMYVLLVRSVWVHFVQFIKNGLLESSSSHIYRKRVYFLCFDNPPPPQRGVRAGRMDTVEFPDESPRL